MVKLQRFLSDKAKSSRNPLLAEVPLLRPAQDQAHYFLARVPASPFTVFGVVKLEAFWCDQAGQNPSFDTNQVNLFLNISKRLGIRIWFTSKSFMCDHMSSFFRCEPRVGILCCFGYLILHAEIWAVCSRRHCHWRYMKTTISKRYKETQRILTMST